MTRWTPFPPLGVTSPAENPSCLGGPTTRSEREPWGSEGGAGEREEEGKGNAQWWLYFKVGRLLCYGPPLSNTLYQTQVERLDFFGCRESGRPLWERDDVVSFSSASLEADVEVCNV